MEGLEYNGYVIYSTPYQLAESGEWNVHVTVVKHKASETIDHPFTANNTFEKKEEAIAHSLEFGKQIVDGKFPEYELAE